MNAGKLIYYFDECYVTQSFNTLYFTNKIYKKKKGFNLDFELIDNKWKVGERVFFDDYYFKCNVANIEDIARILSND